jgi:hypothetical protein
MTLDTSYTHLKPPLHAPTVSQKALTLSRKVDESKPLITGGPLHAVYQQGVKSLDDDDASNTLSSGGAAGGPAPPLHHMSVAVVRSRAPSDIVELIDAYIAKHAGNGNGDSDSSEGDAKYMIGWELVESFKGGEGEGGGVGEYIALAGGMFRTMLNPHPLNPKS